MYLNESIFIRRFFDTRELGEHKGSVLGAHETRKFFVEHHDLAEKSLTDYESDAKEA